MSTPTGQTASHLTTPCKRCRFLKGLHEQGRCPDGRGHFTDSIAMAAQEAWVKRYAGYFGEPLKLDEFRAGEITFRELYRNSISRAGDMVSEASSVSEFAFNENIIAARATKGGQSK